MDSRSKTAVSSILTPFFWFAIVITGELSFAFYPVGIVLPKSLAIRVPNGDINHCRSHFPINNVVEDVTIGFQWM